MKFPVRGNGQVMTYTIPVMRSPSWKGTITRLELLPCRKGGKGKRLRLGSIQTK